MTKPNQPSAPRDSRSSATSPTGSSRAGRRDVQRRRYESKSTMQRLRTPILAIAVVAVIVGVSFFVLQSAAAPAYACTSIDTVQPAASGVIGQVQPDMGAGHVATGDKITYPVCPPASGKHVNKTGFGPLTPDVYGPDDNNTPNGWVHNLEHGGLVLLYSCDKGACDDASLAALQAFSDGFPNSPVCDLPAGFVGPVIARFEQMPTRYAALLWDRVLYLDTLDTARIYDFFTKYSEILASDGTFIAPPEKQCVAPSPSPAAGESPSAAPSSEASPSAAPSAEASPSAAVPSTEPSPSPSAS